MCVFCGIIKGEIPCSKVYEDELVFAFNDINPKTQTHILVIPKIHIENLNHINTALEKEAVSACVLSIPIIAKNLGLSDFRMISNNGKEAGQEVFHLHFHILSGQSLPRF